MPLAIRTNTPNRARRWRVETATNSSVVEHNTKYRNDTSDDVIIQYYDLDFNQIFCIENLGSGSITLTNEKFVLNNTLRRTFILNDTNTTAILVREGEPNGIFPAIPTESINQLHFQQVVLDASNITNKELTLNEDPTNPEVFFADILSCGSILVGLDFDLTGNTLSWSGFELENILQIGDIFHLRYEIM